MSAEVGFDAMSVRIRRQREEYLQWLGLSHIYVESRETVAAFNTWKQVCLLEDILSALAGLTKAGDD